MASVTGKAVWHDLMTPDVEKSIDFYGKLLGWTTEDWEMPGGKVYKMIKAGEKMIGGFDSIDPSAGVPPHWMAYVTVEDVDAAATKTEGGGGKVLLAPTDIPEVGRFAVISGPEGACISPFKSLNEAPEEEGPPGEGVFCWDELLTSDTNKSREFYSSLFSWGVKEMDMGEMGSYFMFSRGEADAAGMMKMPPGAEAPPAWLSYINVSDLDGTTGKVQGLGGMVFVQPTEIPGAGRFSVCADNLGSTFGLFEAAKG